MSESRPAGSRSEPVASMYPSATHWTKGMVAPKSVAIRGNAKVTPVWSSTDTNVPAAIVRRISRRLRASATGVIVEFNIAQV